jgi:hypothetical protein
VCARRRAPPRALLFFEICYGAFQAGFWRMAEASSAPAERLRQAAQAERYVRLLGKLAQAAESSD